MEEFRFHIFWISWLVLIVTSPLLGFFFGWMASLILALWFEYLLVLAVSIAVIGGSLMALTVLVFVINGLL